MTRLRSSQMLADARNLSLLRLLAAAPRSSISYLARKIGMSAPAVRERLQRLEEAGVISGYRLEIDPGALGYPIAAFVRIRPAPGQLQKVAALAQKIPQISECYRITGEDCFIAKLHLDNLESLDKLLDQFLAFGQTTTSLVQSVVVARRNLPLSKTKA